MKSTDSESSEKRDIFQYHFTSWPDHSVPRDTSAFLMFHHKLRSALAVDPGPTVVHCRYLFIYLFICLFIYSGANLKLMCFVNNTQSLVWMEGLKHRNVSVFKKERINVDAGPMGVTKCTSSVAA